MPIIYQDEPKEWGSITYEDDVPFPDIRELGQKAYESRLRAREARDKLEEELAARESDAKKIMVPIPGPLGMPIGFARMQPETAGAIASTAPRVLAPLGAATSLTGVGTIPGLAIMGASTALGEIGGQLVEKELGAREELSPAAIGAAGILGSIPGAQGIRQIQNASRITRAAVPIIEGSGYGALFPVIEAGLDGRVPEAEDVKMGGLIGGALGLPFGVAGAARGTPKPPKPPKSVQILTEPTTKPPSIANVATEIGTQTAESPFALQARLNQMTEAQRRPIQQLALEETFSRLPPKSAQESAEVFQQTMMPQIETDGIPAELGVIAGARQQASAERLGRALMELGEAPVIQEPANVPRKTLQDIRKEYIRTAIEAPDVDYQYVVQDFGPEYPRVVQVDAISDGESLASGTVAEFTGAGAKIPEVPEWVPQGKYTREQMEQLIKGGPDALQIRSAEEVLQRQPPEDGEAGGGRGRVEPHDEGAQPAGDLVREGEVPEPRTEVEQLMASAPPFEAAPGRSPEVAQQASRMRSTREAVEQQSPVASEQIGNYYSPDSIVLEDFSGKVGSFPAGWAADYDPKTKTVLLTGEWGDPATGAPREVTVEQAREIARTEKLPGDLNAALDDIPMPEGTKREQSQASTQSEEPSNATAHEKNMARRKARENEVAEKKAAEDKGRERFNAFRKEVRAVPIKGRQEEISISILPGDANIGQTARKEMAMVYGDWAIHKTSKGKNPKYTVTHVPSGLKAYETESLGSAKEIVQAFMLSGADSSRADLNLRKEDLKKLIQAIIALREGADAPEWFRGSVKSGRVGYEAQGQSAPVVDPRTLEAISNKRNRRPYNPDFLSEDSINAAKAAGLISGPATNPKLTKRGMEALSDFSSSEKSRQLAEGAEYDRLVEEGVPPEEAIRIIEASRMRSTRGVVAPRALAPLGGGATGGAIGYMNTERRPGESDEQYRERLLRNTIVGAGIGLTAGIGASSAFAQRRAVNRKYTTPELKRVETMLTPKEEKVPLMRQVEDAYNNLRFRFNTRYAPIGQAQRTLFKEAGMEFTPNKYYDLERGFERLSGAPVQAEGEVALLQNIVDKLGPHEAPHLDTYLILARIRDRLLKTGEENAALQDAVVRSREKYDAAAAKFNQSPSEINAMALANRRSELKRAEARLSEEFNRKRVADWSVADAEKGLADLKAQVGNAAYAKLEQAGLDFQDVMRRALDIQVDSGRMSADLRDRVLSSNDFYAPFKVLRHFEENEPFVKGGSVSRIPSSEQLAKKITGIDDMDVRLGSPLAVAAEQIYKGYILAQKNRKLIELAALSRIDPEGSFVKPLGEGMDPRKGYEAVSYFVNGEPKRMEVYRPIAEALNGTSLQETDIILSLLGKGASVFKLGATGLSIPFNLANALVHDPVRLATISKYGFRGPQDFLWTLYEWPAALFSSARGNIGQYLGMKPGKLYEQWIRSGAANSTLARVLNPEVFAARLPLSQKGLKGVYAESNFGMGTPIKIASLMSNTLEETTKILGLKRAIRIENLEKLPPAERQRKWDEIVTEIRNYAGSPDFARMGVNMRALNILMPFLNPRWQGAISDFARLNPLRHGNAKDAGAAWARLAVVVGIPAAALAVYNRSTPENARDYNQIPKREREAYYHIPLYVGPDGKPSVIDYGKGGYYFKNRDGVNIRGYYRIPKREFAGLLGNTIDDFVEYAQKESPETFSQIASDFGERLFGTMSPVSFQGDTTEERISSAAAGVNPVLRVPVETALNRSFFTGRNIVPESRKDASPELQYTERTPEAYKRAAKALPDIVPEMLRSPAKFQHITEGMTGGFARQFFPPRLSPGNPANEVDPLLSRFYRSEYVEDSKLREKSKAALRGRADERIRHEEQANALAELFQSASPENRQAILQRAQQVIKHPEVWEYFKEALIDTQRGLNYEDRMVKRNFPVAGGFRGRYYMDKRAQMAPDEWRIYAADQYRKGLLTDDVIKQLAVSEAVAKSR